MGTEGNKNRALLSLLMLALMLVCSFYHAAFDYSDALLLPSNRVVRALPVTGSYRAPDFSAGTNEFLAVVSPAGRITFLSIPFRRAFILLPMAVFFGFLYCRRLNGAAVSNFLRYHLWLLRKMFKQAGPGLIFYINAVSGEFLRDGRRVGFCSS